jgi:hypothetical protein
MTSKALPEKLNDNKFQEIMSALTFSEGSPDRDIERIVEERGDAIKETAKLVLGNEKVNGWLDTETAGTLWISVQPGVDTKMMSVALQRKLLDIKKSVGADKAEAHVCYFFCDDTHRKKNNTLSILKAFIWQLITQTKRLALHLPLEQERNTGRKKSQSSYISYDSVSSLDLAFQAMLRDPSIGIVYLVVDSLNQVDEESRRDLLDIIEGSLYNDEIRTAIKPKVRWICVGVNRPDIEGAMRHATHVTPEDLGTSSERYNALKSLVRRRVTELAKKLHYPKEYAYWLRTELTERAEGNATWIDLACGEIESVAPEPVNVRSFAEHLKHGLTPLYRQIQERVRWLNPGSPLSRRMLTKQ